MTKELQELNEWKVGQAVVAYGNCGNTDSILHVTRITDGRGGTIYIKEIAYDVHGHQRGSDAWYRGLIKPATPEDIARVRGEVAKAYLSNFKWSRLTGEQAIQVDTFLGSIGINIREKNVAPKTNP